MLKFAFAQLSGDVCLVQGNVCLLPARPDPLTLSPSLGRFSFILTRGLRRQSLPPRVHYHLPLLPLGLLPPGRLPCPLHH
jgi:hypothetical protein